MSIGTLMHDLQVALSVGCGLAVLWLLVLIVRDRSTDGIALGLAALVELGVVVNLVLGVVRVVQGADGVAVWEYVGYLIGALLILPAGLVWSAGERNRGGTTVLLFAFLVVPFLFVRMADIWAAGAR